MTPTRDRLARCTLANMTPSGHEVSDATTRRVAGLAGTVLFGAASVIELVRMSTLKFPWPGFTNRIDWVVSGIAIVLWSLSAIVLAIRSHRHGILAVLGVFALFAYGILGTAGGSRFGILYIVLAAALVVLERLAFRGKVPIGHRVGEPVRPSSGREIL